MRWNLTLIAPRTRTNRKPPSSALGVEERAASDHGGSRRDGGLGFGGGFAAGFPGPGRQFVDLAGWMIRQPCQHVSEPGARIDIIELAGLCRMANYAERLLRQGQSQCIRRTMRVGGARHSLEPQRAFRNSSSRSLGRNRFALSRSYSLSLANAASLSSRCTWR